MNLYLHPSQQIFFICVQPRYRENRQATPGKHQQGNKRGDAISVPFLVLASAPARDNKSSMTRRRWIADSFTDTTATLTGAHAEHLARVLRAQPGTQAEIVVNGRVYLGTVVQASVEEVVFDLTSEVAAESALPVTLLISVFKFDRMEWAIEKATELGVSAIVPILARRTEKHLAQAAGKRVERWRRIAQEAAQQSRRADIPVIEEPISLAARLASPSTAQHILLAENERDLSLHRRITEILSSTEEGLPGFELAIGPEGGWTNEELSLFEKQGWQSASLGPRILRAETAAIAALAITAALLSST